MGWKNLRAELEEEFSQLEGHLPRKCDNNITHTAALTTADQVQRWKKANPERWKAICKRYREKNREKLRQKARGRAKPRASPQPKTTKPKLTREEIAAKAVKGALKWRALNPEKHKEIQAAYRERNRERIRERDREYRARKKHGL